MSWTAESPFAPSDIYSYNSQLDSLIPFGHPQSDIGIDGFLESVKDYNFANAEFSSGLLSFGWRADKSYWSFHLKTKFQGNMSAPGDLFPMILKGFPHGSVYDLSTFSMNMNAYTELGIGVSNQVLSNLTIGIRPKMLFGHVNFDTDPESFVLNTTRQLWSLDSDMEVNMNIPYMSVATDEEGFVDSLYIDEEAVENAESINDHALGNIGIGLDFGAHYRPIDELNLSLSVIDFGFISWNSNPINIRMNGTFDFDAIEYDSIDADSDFEYMVDSLFDVTNPTPTYNAYSNFLNTRIYAGATYDLLPRLNVGLLSKTHFFNGSIREQVTLSVNGMLGNWLSGTFSYSLSNYSMNGLGFGFMGKLGPFQMYFVLDNIPVEYAKDVETGAPIPFYTQATTGRFGMNLVFGCNRLEKKFKDKPLLY
jgi:hypothetical protein